MAIALEELMLENASNQTQCSSRGSVTPVASAATA
jgi:hypothetical protein